MRSEPAPVVPVADESAAGGTAAAAEATAGAPGPALGLPVLFLDSFPIGAGGAAAVGGIGTMEQLCH